MIETEVIECVLSAYQRAKRIAQIVNAREAKGDELISVVPTVNYGAILLFRTKSDK